MVREEKSASMHNIDITRCACTGVGGVRVHESCLGHEHSALKLRAYTNVHVGIVRTCRLVRHECVHTLTD